MSVCREETDMTKLVKTRRARLAAWAMRPLQAAANPASQLEIASLRVFPVREPVSGRTYAVLKLQTRSGLAGYGECPGATEREAARLLEAVRGREATLFETLRHRVQAPPGLMAALNMAMLDVVGRHVNAPVYQVLGGPTRNKVRAMAPLEGDTDAELVAAVRRAREAGHRVFLVPAPPPIWPRNQGQAYMLAARRRLDALREAAGPGTDFVLDGGGLLLPADAAGLAATLERFRLLWLEEPFPISNLGAVRKIANESVAPLGLGRHIHQPGAFQDLLREDALDVLRPDISLNGISQIRQMAAIAETYYVAVAPYHNGGPIASAAAIQLAATLPNFFIQQFPFPRAEQDRRMRAAIAGGSVEAVGDGYAELSVSPGLGISVDEKALEEYRERAA
jgi:galactonate dehydratase